MKRIILITLVAIALATSTAIAQSALHKDALGFRSMLVDYQGPYNGEFENFQAYKPGFELFYSRSLHQNFNLFIPFRAGLGRMQESTDNFTFAGLDVQLQWQYKRPNKPVTPYLFAGVGGAMIPDSDMHAEIPLGGGLDIHLSERVSLNTFVSYRLGFPGDLNSFQHGIGFKYHLVKKKKEEKEMEEIFSDIDGDGVPDHLDECPTIPGLPEFDGCPDTDGDGIPDHLDDCPLLAGLPEFGGCPDTDGDGIPDHLDDCPTEPGPKENRGCPYIDSDGDGVPDHLDKCPNEPGLPEFDGCPDTDGDGIPDHLDDCPLDYGPAHLKGCPDTDGDGVPDYMDKCPLIPGPASNFGCPELNKQEKEVLDKAMRSVQFDLGSDNLKSSSFPVLNQIVEILKKYPSYNLSIEGHTDTTGSPEFNLRLSESRAKACKEYLITRGIDPDRMTFKGYGITKPRFDNRTEEGRQLNRRVEFIMLLD